MGVLERGGGGGGGGEQAYYLQGLIKRGYATPIVIVYMVK